MKRLSLTYFLFVLLLLEGCQTSPLKRNEIQLLTNSKLCSPLLDQADWGDEVGLLKLTQDLFRASCFKESLQLGRLLRERLLDKDYSVTAEALSVLGPEQMTQTYVLESHERVYLTLLLVMNHLGLEQKDAAQVELRRASNELDAIIYTHGRDEVSALLIATLWQELGEDNLTAPFWRRLGLEEFEARGLTKPWRIYAVGELGAYDWSFGGSAENGFYKIKPKNDLPEKCVSKTGVLIPVRDWVQKMSIRHASTYHPLLNLKSFVRLPIGLGYGLALGGAGVTVAVDGCALTSQGRGGGNANACGEAIKTGAWIVSKAPSVFDYAVQPDLRHWPESPAAFLVTRAQSLEDESCATRLNHASLR